eukprot:TRINITY_DN32435_c0_g1_i1.p1 TRINITY_DN32435_c0_g1~~TRINITY_DN32435_c0_g1_i1.p1  ORF type:complete len:735 (-),score=181.07 TRINITY_DN32435_c0_g1_i1:16-2220(-)
MASVPVAMAAPAAPAACSQGFLHDCRRDMRVSHLAKQRTDQLLRVTEQPACVTAAAAHDDFEFEGGASPEELRSVPSLSASWAVLGGTALGAVAVACAARRRRGRGASRVSMAAKLELVQSRTEPRKLKVSRGKQASKQLLGAVKLWGGDRVMVNANDHSQGVSSAFTSPAEVSGGSKWKPKRDLWPGSIKDDKDDFGALKPGNECTVERKRYGVTGNEKESLFVAGVVVAVNEEENVAAVMLPDAARKDVLEVTIGEGLMSRPLDPREMCTKDEIDGVMRRRKDESNGRSLVAFAGDCVSIPGRSHALITLCRMDLTDRAQEVVDQGQPVASIAIRELAHGFARNGRISKAVSLLSHIEDVLAAQLLVEVLALALTERIRQEKERLGVTRLINPDKNEAVQQMVSLVNESLRELAPYVTAVRTLPSLRDRQGFTEAFNELMHSCGRALAPPLSFRVLEWMEQMAVPKDNFTYEAIGVNVVKQVRLLRKVWDLPMAPEEGVPEVVFAGRSNVGKSSLVNMLVNRLALAPTSARPGKTKTMDFFDVNAHHPSLPRFRLVDVPGLGFARASRDMRERWINMIGGYFAERRSLKIVFHLLDAGLCEILPPDRDLWKLLSEARREDFELCICLTKSDNTSPAQIERFATRVREELRKEGTHLAVHATIFACSARSKLGKDTLWRKIWKGIGGYELDGQGPPETDKFRRKEEFGPDYDENSEVDAFIKSKVVYGAQFNE